MNLNPTFNEAHINHPKPNHIHFEINVHVSLHFCDERTIRTNFSSRLLLHCARVFITLKVTMALKPYDRLKFRTLGYYRPNLVTNRPIIYKDFCLVRVLLSRARVSPSQARKPEENRTPKAYFHQSSFKERHMALFHTQSQ